MSDVETNLADFIKAVTESGHIWVLSADSEYVVVDSIEFEATDVMPLFSTEAAAKALCIDDWADYSVASISIDDFFEEWLPSLDEDGVRVGLDWNSDLTGGEMDPFTLAKALADSESE
ncbi:DUF2750 domain-containing protein [uncultured Ferrimonas sp.]|uniref:DUF2750 domain-containing protein n=1 Tax=uncultured Ferrimonas sp. TaxID=432640 RepID=UPI00261A690E|nr:DUF2750 domain-containing protein [uncultured Ferrimonas sp.]